MMRRRGVVVVLALVAEVSAQGAGGVSARLEEWRKSWTAREVEWEWREDGNGVFWKEAEGVVAVGRDGKIRRAAKAEELGISEREEGLPPQKSFGASRASSRETKVVFESRLKKEVRLFWVDQEGVPQAYGVIEPGKSKEQRTFVGHVWIADFQANDLAGIFVAARRAGKAILDEESVRKAQREEKPKREREVLVRDHNVWLRRGEDSVALSSRGSGVDPYHLPGSWSPGEDRVLGFQIAPAETHLVNLIESKPKDQVQPKLHSFDYLKPKDRIARPRPRLFDLKAQKEILIDDAPFENAWSLNHVRWAKDGSEVYLLKNERGHQRLTVFAINARTGAVRTVLEEKTATFIDYSQKLIFEWLGDEERFLWASERDGWNHLYVVDAKSGETRQLTRGEWVVRRLEHVDRKSSEVWFAACGLRKGEDPYHVHLARISLDGTGLKVLTEGDGTHTWTFSPGRQLFVDRWSRVDQPWVTELRRASDGGLIAELFRDDATKLLERGFRLSKRFVAKGRDGKTDIHGIAIFPSTHDPKARYPVIEDIYAGPHGHHVPKTFGLSLRQRALSELGFIVVQIDGMGTNWRSKAFHDLCFQNLKDSGFPDRIAWMKAFAAEHPEADLSRVGIFGGSAGGQSALSALLHHGDFYRVAVSDCGCHDNRMDKIWWNEAWMGLADDAIYADSSNVTHAAKLKGKLLLTVGELDRNVDPASTMQVVGALIEANKDFDFVLVPGAGHGVGETPYLVRRRQEFFQRHLLGVEGR